MNELFCRFKVQYLVTFDLYLSMYLRGVHAIGFNWINNRESLYMSITALEQHLAVYGPEDYIISKPLLLT